MNERQIFEGALEFTDPEDRRAFLDKACGDNAELRASVEALLTSHEAPSQFLKIPAVEQLQGNIEQGLDQTIDRSVPAQSSDDDETAPDLSFLQPSTKPGSIGSLGHYEVLQVLGQGAFGIVLRAFDEKLHRQVAIKAMNPQLAATSPPRKRFLREARSVAAIKHENIVQIYSVEEQPLPYLVMEFVQGQTLQQKLDSNGPLDVPEVLHLARQMAAGLAAAHALGLIHRDIKPGNILLEQGAEQKVKITDFGLARAADDASMTNTGVISGTPLYMAPEQAQGLALDARTDLFSLGSVLYQMCTGRPPFRAPTTIAVLRRVAEDTPRSMREIIEATPTWLETIVFKLLAKDPEERYQSAKEVADLFARCQNELQINGKVTCVAGVEVPQPKSAPPSIEAPKSKPVPSPIDPPSASPTKRPNRALLAVAAVILLLIGVIGATEAGRTKFTNLFLKKKPGPSPEIVKANANDSGQRPVANTGWQGWPADAPKPAIAPFNEEQAKKHQQEWADYLNVPVEWENSIGMQFVLIPPGEFLMGSTEEEITAVLGQSGNDKNWPEIIKSESPRHKVVITQPFYLAIHEVTQSQYEAVTQKNPSLFSVNGDGKDAVRGLDTGNHPVEMVTWHDAAEFTALLSKREKLKPCYSRVTDVTTRIEGTGYRMPTEAEWELACRAGTTTKYWFGDQDESLNRTAWTAENSNLRTHAVGELRANPLGLFDLQGNVWEWVEDFWEPNYYAKLDGKPAVNPLGPVLTDPRRVVRGGGFTYGAAACRSSNRLVNVASIPVGNCGFRVALSWKAVRELIASQETAWQSWPADAPKPAIAPFNADQAKKHQKEWADYLKIPVEYENSLGMKFVLIPPGEFLMGSSEEEISAALGQTGPDKVWPEIIKSESPRHKVITTQPFYLAIHEVTQSQYAAVTQQNPSIFSATGAGKDVVRGLDTANHPVESVTWHDAAQFTALLSGREKLKPCYARVADTATRIDGDGYRLPTEAEWELACRAGTTTKYSFGDDDQELNRAGWIAENSGGRTHIVGELIPNPLGLFDMQGNVWEWVEDSWEPTYYAQLDGKPAVNPQGAQLVDPRKVIRGGGFTYGAAACRSSNRLVNEAGKIYGNCGFRVALPWQAVRESLASKGTSWQGRPADAPLPSIDPIDYSAERKAAEYLASVLTKGYVQLTTKKLTPEDKTIPAGDFTITRVNLLETNLDDAGMLNLAGCRRMRSFVTQDNKSVTVDGLQQLSACKTIEILTIGKLVGDPIPLLANWPGLQDIYLSGPDLTAAAVENIPSLPQLHNLNFNRTALSTENWATLQQRCPNLRMVHQTDIPANGPVDLKGMEVLRQLEAFGGSAAHLTDANVQVWLAMPKLEKLEFKSPNLDEPGSVARLLPLADKLTSLVFNPQRGPGLGDADYDAIAKLRRLRTFKTGVKGAPTDAHLLALAALPDLQQLDLDFAEPDRRYTPAGIAAFGKARPEVRLMIDGKEYAP